MSVPTKTPSLVISCTFLFTVFLCVCLFGSSFWLYYISSDELILFFPKGYELFFLCYNSACESWSKPGADTRKLGLQSAESWGGRRCPNGLTSLASELFSPHLCKAENATEPLLLPHPRGRDSTIPTCNMRFSGPSHCHGKTGTFGAGGHHVGCLYN